MINVKNFTLVSITAEEIRNNSIREYNAREWDKTIDRFLKFDNVQFYILPKGNGYDYDRFYVVYSLENGFRLFNQVCYSTCLSNGGYCRIAIREDGTVDKYLFKYANGKEGYAENCENNTIKMATQSRCTGAIFTTIL